MCICLRNYYISKKGNVDDNSDSLYESSDDDDFGRDIDNDSDKEVNADQGQN